MRPHLLLAFALTFTPLAAQTDLGGGDADTASSTGESQGSRFGEQPLQLARIAPAEQVPFEPPQRQFVSGIRRVPDYGSGNASNPCGPYGTVAVARSFGDNSLTFADGYSRMAPSHFGLGTGPAAMERYLQQQGRNSTAYNNMMADELAARVDRGERGLLLVNMANGDPEASMRQKFESMHWMAVRGYQMAPGADGTPQRHWLFEDTALSQSGAFTPNGRYPNGVPEDELQRLWSRPVPRGFGTVAGNLNNYYIGVGEEQPTAWNRFRNAAYLNGDQTRLRVAMDGAYDATRGWDRTFAPLGQGSVGDRIGGFGQMVSGAGLKGGLNLVPATVSTVGSAVESGGDAMLDWGRERYHRGGLLNRSAGVAATIGGSVPKVAGWAVEGVGNLGSSAVGVASDAIQGTGNLIGRGVDWVGSWF